MAELSGDGAEVDLGNGIRLSAPGLTGTALAAAEALPHTTAAGKLFDHALGNAGFTRRPPVHVAHTSAATGDVTVTFPPPAPGNNALLLIHDSTGAVSWHKPDQPTAAAAAFQARNASGAAAPVAASAGTAPAQSELTFTVPGGRFAANPAHRSWLATLTDELHHFHFEKALGGPSKALSVLEYPIDHLAEWGATKWIDQWDRNKHPAVIRWFPPTGGQAVGEAMSPTNWGLLDRANGPVLLFIHGIFSNCNGAFGAIGQDDHTWSALRALYQGRTLGYDHPTVAVGPEQNALDFLAQIPEGITLDVDIVCHSRGGLVARALAGQTELLAAAGAKVNVRKIIFAATPNGGSQIAAGSNWGTLIDRISSLLTLPEAMLPPPVDEVAGILAGVLEVVKVVGVDTAADLPGLSDMEPGSDLLGRFASFTGTPPQYYAAASDFEPGPVLANLFHSIDDLGRILDKAVFPGVRNDIAVPTNGVWDPANPNGLSEAPAGAVIAGFPIPDDRRLPIGAGSVYWHSAYFEDQAMRDALVRWLTPSA